LSNMGDCPCCAAESCCAATACGTQHPVVSSGILECQSAEVGLIILNQSCDVFPPM